LEEGGNPLRAASGPLGDEPAATLARRHFAGQDRRPSHLGELSPASMEPFLRGLLFTDGTVTRTLEVESLSRVAVRVIGQAREGLGAAAAQQLEAPAGIEALRRRVTIGPADAAEPAIWAESHILAERLPAAFLAELEGSRDGIGGSLQRVELESCRELLWYGLDEPPEWSFVAPRAPAPVLTRLYRVIAGGCPALLISESFAVEPRGELYGLRWPG